MSRSLSNGTNLINAPALNGAVVTPSDSADLPNVARGVYCGTAGDLKVTTINGDVITFTSLVGGVIHPICAARIWSTGTTAANIIAVY
jgi:hypothetical protein